MSVYSSLSPASRALNRAQPLCSTFVLTEVVDSEAVFSCDFHPHLCELFFTASEIISPKHSEVTTSVSFFI